MKKKITLWSEGPTKDYKGKTKKEVLPIKLTPEPEITEVDFGTTKQYNLIASEIEICIRDGYITDDNLIKRLQTKYSDEDIIKTLMAFLRWIY